MLSIIPELMLAACYNTELTGLEDVIFTFLQTVSKAYDPLKSSLVYRRNRCSNQQEAHQCKILPFSCQECNFAMDCEVK